MTAPERIVAAAPMVRSGITVGLSLPLDTAPSRTEGVSSPTREPLGRWEFLCLIASLRIPGGAGSRVNPIAVF
jgi:hypothetical protein